MSSTCATMAPKDHRHPLFQLRAKMQRCDHKYAVPPPLPMTPTKAAATHEVSANTPPSTPPSARDAERLVAALSPPPTPGRHRRCPAHLGGSSKRDARAVDVSSYPEFLPSSRKRRLPSSSFVEKERRVAALKKTKTNAAPPTFSILPLFESCWVAEAHAKLSKEGGSDRSKRDEGGHADDNCRNSTSIDASSAPAVPFAPFTFGGVGRPGPGVPLLPFMTSPELRRQASLNDKMEDMTLRSPSTQAATGAKGQAFRKRTGMYARGA